MTQELDNNNQTIHFKKRLSVQVSLTGLSFLVTSVDRKEVYFFSKEQLPDINSPEELLVSLQQSLRSNPQLSDNVVRVTLTYATDIYTVVPAELFEENKASEYLKFNSKILATDYIASDILEKQGLVVVFVPFMNINNFLFENFGSFEYYPNASLLLRFILEEERFNTEQKVFLHIQEGQLDCIAIEGTKLLLCNTFPYKTKEDLLYYVLFCLEQLKMNPNTVEVSVMGSITERDENFELLFTYIRNLSILKVKNANLLSIEEEPAHDHIPLKTTP